MNKNGLAERLSEKTGLDTAACLNILDKADKINIFSKTERSKVRAAVSEAVGCDEKQAEKIRKDMISVISGEVKRALPKAVISVALLFAAAVLTVKLIKGRKR